MFLFGTEWIKNFIQINNRYLGKYWENPRFSMCSPTAFRLLISFDGPMFCFFAWVAVPGKTADWERGMCVVCSGSCLVTPISFHFTPLVILSFLPYVSQFPLTPGALPSACEPGQCHGQREMEKEAGVEGERDMWAVWLCRGVLIVIDPLCFNVRRGLTATAKRGR